jgi:hypothetical protein
MLSFFFFIHHVFHHVAFSFFFQLSFSLNSWWFNFFSTISRIRTWVIKSHFYKASQPSMHVNDIQLIDRHRVFGYSSSRPFSFFLFPSSLCGVATIIIKLEHFKIFFLNACNEKLNYV